MSYYLPDTMCIVIASHISNASRVPYLTECLLSLVRQTIPVQIYLSISFENNDLHEFVLTSISQIDELFSSSRIIIFTHDKKTPQMRHIEYLLSNIDVNHEWILFCDDDDTYKPNRVELFAETIAQCIRIQLPQEQTIVGAYESTYGKDHREQRHEFWCYCVRRILMTRFFDILRNYPDVLDNKCCDVLFAEFLRRSNPNCLFARIAEQTYNYRVENNGGSVTGFIKANQSLYTHFTEPPPEDHASRAEYVSNWNAYVRENIAVYLHDTYLRTLVGVLIDDILTLEFRANAPILDHDNNTRIREYHNHIRKACNEVYDTPITT